MRPMTESVADDAAVQGDQLMPWWSAGPPLRTRREIDEFIDAVHFMVMFGGDKHPYPCLREACRDDSVPHSADGWGADLELLWEWKDEAPTRAAAWCGRLVGRRLSAVSPHLLGLLYALPGEPEDVLTRELSENGRRVAEFLLGNGPSSTTELTQAVCGSKQLDRVRTELGLLITHYGVASGGSGWPSVVLELTARAFPGVGGAGDDRAAAAVFRQTMGDGDPRMLGRAFGWTAARARAALEG